MQDDLPKALHPLEMSLSLSSLRLSLSSGGGGGSTNTADGKLDFSKSADSVMTRYLN